MRSERQYATKFWILMSIMILFLATAYNTVEIKSKKKRIRKKRKLQSEKSDESVQNIQRNDDKEDIDDEEIEYPQVDKNMYEAKMIEFEDEVEGQYYLDAITWEDRYWLDFHNLLQTVKGKLN